MARIAIIGAGAIGSVIATLLETTGRHEVFLCARRSLPSLTVDTPTGPAVIRAQIFTDPAAVSAADWVLVVTKAYDCASAALWFPALRASGAPVAVLQNGVEHRERFVPYVAAEFIVPVVVDCPVERKSPTLVHQRGVMHLKAAEDALGQQLVALFRGTPADAVCVPDIDSVAWRKLCSNAVGVLPTLLLRGQGVLRSEALSEVARQIVRETVAVAQAAGVTFEQPAEVIVEAVIDAYHSAPADGINSMHADRLAGRPMELDARNGVIVRMGRKYGIPTPANSMAVALVEAMTA